MALRCATLLLKILQIGLTLFKPPYTEYMDPSLYSEHIIENIGQSVRFTTEIRKESFSDNNKSICQKWVVPGQ